MQGFSATKFRALRKAAGYSQKALGTAVGTSERRVQFWEAAEVEPSATYLLRIMVLLQCQASDLLDEGSSA